MNRYKSIACGALWLRSALYRITGRSEPTHRKKPRRVNWLRALLRPESPSRVMSESGANYAQGFSEGVAKK